MTIIQGYEPAGLVASTLQTNHSITVSDLWEHFIRYERSVWAGI